MSEIICPACKGAKQIYRQCFPTVLSGWHPCETCGASGSITEEKQTIIDLAGTIRAKRRELKLSPSAIAGLVPLSENFWRTVEDGKANRAVTEYALRVIEGIAAQFVDRFDVYQNGAFGKREKIGTYNSLLEAETARDDARMVSGALNIAVLIEIVPRKERIQEANK